MRRADPAARTAEDGRLAGVRGAAMTVVGVAVLLVTGTTAAARLWLRRRKAARR